MNQGSFLSYDFIQLEQAAEKVTDEDADVIYVVAHLHDGKVAAYQRAE